MSTRELAYNFIDMLSEEQLDKFIAFMKAFVEFPNEETMQAMREADKIGRDNSRKRFNSFDELLEDIENEN